MAENINKVEMHGCLVCARIYNVLAIYSPDNQLINCTVMSPGGHCVHDDAQPLVACDTHTTDQIEKAYKRWKSRNEKG
jgi:hypothetical protein